MKRKLSLGVKLDGPRWKVYPVIVLQEKDEVGMWNKKKKCIDGGWGGKFVYFHRHFYR